MKKHLARSLLAAWILTATLTFCRFFVTHPHLFPPIPESWALWLVDAYGARSQEDVADLEGWTGLVLGFIATSLTTWLALRAWRHLKRPKPSD
ncbi:hypothetical protein [Ralstonia pseudosolanacearum]|uniref:Transmembrane protein n=1 Tax=Ralstonia solanacearum TaxID=305 RepID=A0A0S4WEJ8_RALSL|nr:hypothetical protein [Ralstonia pseudosolanacearum]CUV44879.1 conserved protein of unknown function [Ralstonia solanacearum]MDO3522894.1 hypothetical protein [Ralstonia pseudosolanacearum]MDO3547412.1 hypothetical protein [Ralstonia pseudosolanacearum]MDO3551961.1 hypothetical protein [Ralstonia pseudosolanacearum]MDO3566325.1 hypothetical protein [Ralstonia pseudosolanacearum]